MAPRKSQSRSKGKQPAKRKAPMHFTPVVSSFGEEDWPDYQVIWGELMHGKEKGAATGQCFGRGRKEGILGQENG